MAKKKRKKGNGFTIVEMTVVTFIILLISGIILANFERGSSAAALNRTASQLALDLRRAQNNALSTTIFQNQAPFGYGLYFDVNQPTTAIMFADLNDNQRYDGADELFETIEIKNNIQLVSVTPANPLTIFFRAPEPTTYINGVNSGGASLTLQPSDNPSLQRQLIINVSGQINIQ